MGILDRFFEKQIHQAARAMLAVVEDENTFLVGARPASSDRDRFSYDRSDLLTQALEAWRTNPLARRIIELTSQYVVGGGLSVNCKHAADAKFLSEFWNHHLNRMPVRVFELCDELSRTGNLFIMLSTDAAGMSYIRVLPASEIDEIISRDNDIEQPLAFKLKANIQELNPALIPAYDPKLDNPSENVILHYAINRPAGAQWGESDLNPLLRWLSRYSNWLEDRARLNRYRMAFLYIVQAKFTSEAARKARQTALNANPPKPGSILVADENENWKAINPRLESGDAERDGLAIKKMIAAGAGVPMHFLAEPESATRTTAEAAGGPTYRRFEQRQEFFKWLLSDLLHAVLLRRAQYDRKIDPESEIQITGADISSRDNSSLALASNYMITVLAAMRDRKLITNDEMVRLIYRFMGETVDAEELIKQAASETDQQGVLPEVSVGGYPKSKIKTPEDPEPDDMKDDLKL